MSEEAGITRAEDRVVRYALARGYLSREDLRWGLLLREELRRHGQIGSLLSLLRRRLDPGCLPELAGLYRQAISESGDPELPASEEVPTAALMQSSALLQRPAGEDPLAVKRALADFAPAGTRPDRTLSGGATQAAPTAAAGTLGDRATHHGATRAAGSGRQQRAGETLNIGHRQQLAAALREELSRDPFFLPHVESVLDHVGELGRGGMGVVERVRDRRLGREAALKRIRGQASASAVARFRREAQITARLDHPSIPPVYEFGTDALGRHAILMRVIEGETLSSALQRYQGDPREELLAELLEALVKVAEAAAYAHSKGIVHRDLKPDNVLVGSFGEVMLMDWGVARELEREDDDLLLADASDLGAGELTQHGALIGTLGYMPPEQAEGKPVDAQADVFALGAILCEVLTGRPPLTGETPRAILMATGECEVELPSERRRNVPRELNALTAAALSRDPADRPSATAFAADLRAFLTGREVSVHRYSLAERTLRAARRHPTRLVAGTLSSLLAAITALLGSQLLLQERTASLRLREEQQVQAEARRKLAQQGQQEVQRERDEVRRQLAANQVHQGDLLVQAGRLREARERYSRARELWLAQGESPFLAELALWELERSAPAPLLSFAGEANAVAVSRDERQLLIGSQAELVRYDLRSGRELGRFRRRGEAPLRALAFLPDGQRALCSSDDGVELYDLEGQRRLLVAPDDDATLQQILVGAGGERFLALRDSCLQLWTLQGLRAQSSIFCGDRGLRALCSSPSGDLALWEGSDGVPRLWDVRSWTTRHALEGSASLRTACFSADGRLALGGAVDGTVFLWSVGEGRLLRRFEGLDRAVDSVAFTPESEEVVALATSGRLLGWDRESGVQTRALRLDGESSGGRFLAEGSVLLQTARRGVQLYSVATTPGQSQLGVHARARDLGWVGAGPLVATAGSDATLRLWDAVAGVELARMQLGAPAAAIALSPAGEQAAVARTDGTLALWDLERGERQRELGPHPGPLEDVVYLASGTVVVAGGQGFSARLLQLNQEGGRSLPEGQLFPRLLKSRVRYEGGELSSDGKLRLVNRAGGELELVTRPLRAWDPRSGDALWSAACGSIYGLSPGSGGLVSASLAGRLTRWGPDGKALGHGELRDPGLALGRPRVIALDEEHLLLQARTLTLWRLTPSGPVLVREVCGEESGVCCATSAPEPGYFFSAHQSGELRVWHVGQAREVRAAIELGARVIAFAPLRRDRSLLALTSSGQLLALDFRRPAAERERLARLEDLRRRLATEEPEALVELAKFYADRGLWRWALSALSSSERSAAASTASLAAWKCERWAVAGPLLAGDPPGAASEGTRLRALRAAFLERANAAAIQARRASVSLTQAEHLVESGALAKASLSLRAASQRGADPNRLALVQGCLSLALGRYQAAAASFRQALTQVPDLEPRVPSATFYLIRAQLHVQAGRLREAIGDYRRAEAVNEGGLIKLSGLPLLIAQAQVALDEHRAALQEVERAFAEVTQPTHDLYLVRARCHAALEHPEQALADYDRAAPRPLNSAFLLERGKFLLQTGRLERARQDLMRAVELQPRQEMPTFSFASAVFSGGGMERIGDPNLFPSGMQVEPMGQPRSATAALTPQRVEAMFLLAKTEARQASSRSQDEGAARAADLRRAVDRLEQACEAGFVDWTRIDEDEDLLLLRENERFQTLRDSDTGFR